MNNLYSKYIKRILDFLFALAALIILSPILLVIAVLVRINLGSPVLFRQERPGQIDPKTGKERIFKLYKFRSMIDAKGDDGKNLPDTVRLTKFGRLIRAASIDELPELLNILKGDMSIVGPRPLTVKYLNYYTKKEHHRHDVKPGLTGWAQINGRNSISWDKKFKYDLEYVQKVSLCFDMKVILLTIKKVLIREGIGQGEQHPGSLSKHRADWLDENGIIKTEYWNKE